MFRRYQSEDVTSISFQLVLLCCPVSSQLKNDSVFTHFHSNSSAATSSATRKNGIIPERPCRIEEQNSINVSEPRAVRPDVHFSTKSWISCILLFNRMSLSVFSYYGKIFDFFVFICISCVGAGINSLMSISDELSSYFFRRKMEKTQPMRGEMDRKVFDSRQSRHLLSL